MSQENSFGIIDINSDSVAYRIHLLRQQASTATNNANVRAVNRAGVSLPSVRQNDDRAVNRAGVSSSSVRQNDDQPTSSTSTRSQESRRNNSQGGQPIRENSLRISHRTPHPYLTNAAARRNEDEQRVASVAPRPHHQQQQQQQQQQQEAENEVDVIEIEVNNNVGAETRNARRQYFDVLVEHVEMLERVIGRYVDTMMEHRRVHRLMTQIQDRRLSARDALVGALCRDRTLIERHLNYDPAEETDPGHRRRHERLARSRANLAERIEWLREHDKSITYN